MASHSEDNLDAIIESDGSSSISSDGEVNGIDQRIVYQQCSVSKIQLTRPPSVTGSQSKSRRPSLDSETPHSVQAASLHGFFLGTVFGVGLTAAYFVTMPHMSLFFAALALFHYLDGPVMAVFFSDDRNSNISPSILKSNKVDAPIEYLQYHVFALVEFIILGYIFPSWKTPGLLNYVGFGFVVVGQVIKTSSIFASRSEFTGGQQYRREQPPESFVKDGVYSLIRHPYLFGIYWWMIGMQIMLMNPVCLCYTIYSLQRVFQEIIDHEEYILEKSFGDAWRRYRRTTSTWLPLIP